MKKLKKKRMEAGLSQSQFADKVGINVRTLQHYEQGTKNFGHARIDTILKVCIALRCRIDELIEDQEIIDLIEEYRK